MKIKLWGVRGSLPAPHPPHVLREKLVGLVDDFLQYQKRTGQSDIEQFMQSIEPHRVSGWGGNTACVEVHSSKQRLIIDGGSGIRPLGEKLMGGPCGVGRGEVHLLMTHFHWDHVIGLPFFVPIFVPGNKIHVYSVQDDAREVFETVFKKPMFPVPFDRLGAEVIFHKLEPRKPKEFNDLKVTPYQLDHPDPCWGFKIEQGNKVFSYCVDTEGIRVSPADLGEDLPLYQNVDLMVFDAQYTFLEAAEKVDWGHSSAPVGLDLAVREGIKRILFVHHDPAASDDKVFEAQKQTQDYFSARLKAAKAQNRVLTPVQWEFAREGMEIEL
ncbi:MAG: MBL fold metallo-hydrolase [Bdellovibrionaceae bacterium]|nr:MBL fold metallo-hydrolase [Pseudobdellovibrionaceae bacterium]